MVGSTMGGRIALRRKDGMMRKLLLVVICTTIGCGRSDNPPAVIKAEKPTGRLEEFHIVVDEERIANSDCHKIMEPVWFTANIYGSYDEYEASLAPFSKPQRLVLAMRWYLAEVENRGHDQFFSNSTGIVWEDARNGFEEIGLPEIAAIIDKSAIRLGGRPSFDRELRIKELENRKPSFRDLDDQLFALKSDPNAKMLDFIRSRPKDFCFDGKIKKLVP
jgi:hypothetical protein